MAFILMLFDSCNTDTLKGKVLYVFNFNNLTISEYQMKFISDEIVEVRTTLTANSFECRTYKNTPQLAKEVILFHYSYKDHILEIPEIGLITKVVSNKGIYQSNDETLYNNSVVEVLDDKKHVEEILMANNQVENVEIYLPMLSNNSEPLLIEEDGKFKPNPKNIHNKSH